MATVLEIHCSALLRDLRRKKGYTLEEFEKLSNGAVKAVVLGSYERGTRAISLARIEQLAELYEVPVEYFFSSASMSTKEERSSFIFDLRRIRRMETLDETLEPVTKFITYICQLRRDWNGEVISLRESDSQTLSLMTSLDSEKLFTHLRLAGAIFASEVSGQRSL
jgi:transcriptional regulator with XRE-family HTH domain